MSPALQRLLGALELLPAFVKTSAWDVVAWNRAAAALTDYGVLAPTSAKAKHARPYTCETTLNLNELLVQGTSFQLK